ncbi:MAG: hypothetical protein GX567_18925 [Clostridia bacterium]|nr:hypothetical protein [Clostridia bacterium]
MGFLLFVLMLVLEIGFLIFSMIRQGEKKQWIRNRCLVDGIEFALFLLLCLFRVADLGIRFKLFFIYLIIRLLLSVIIYLIKVKKTEGMKRKAGMIGSILLCMVLTLISLVPSFIFTGYQGTTNSGTHPVATAKAILIDESREEGFEQDGSKREIPAYFFYPEDAQDGDSYPLILFSHGAFGYYQSNTSTYTELASNGYVVISLDHPYHSFYTKDTTGKTITVDPTFINNAIYINNNNVDGDEVLALSSDWVKIRKDDMKFVIDTVKKAVSDGALSDEWFLGQKDTQTQKNQILDVLNVTDCDRIGLMGHSLGGAAAVNLGRERQDIAAVIDLDGTMLGEETGYENGAYLFNEDPYPLPLLSIDNESHYKDGQTAGSYYVNNVIIDRAVQGHHTYIINSGHMNFTDLPLFAPPLAKLLGVGTVDAKHCIDTTNEIVLSFMNYYVKQEGTLNIQESYE